MSNGANKSNLLQWVTIMANDNKDESDEDAVKIPDIPDIDAGVKAKPKSNKRLSVERIYQKKTQLEHILLRPDTYVGSVEAVTQQMWVYDEEAETMVWRDLTFVPGIYKIFDEILVNAADNKQRDPKMNLIKIDIDPENNKIKIWNNGKGIPVVHHKTEDMYVPTLIFGHLLTSSNYDDTEKKVTGGRNGYGAKLANIFSTKFVVETQCGEYKKAFKQTWSDNMNKTTEPKIAPNKGDDYTSVTFYPDLKRFKMESLDKDIVDLFTRRAYDIAAVTSGVKVFLNGKKLPVKNFKDYIDLYIKDKVDDTNAPLKLVHEKVNDRWEIAVTLSDKGFQQVSFVNSIATTKGGRHTDYISDQLVSKIIDVVKKKEKKGSGVNIKPFQVRGHLWVFVNCLVENPTFDSQTKENMTLQAKSFGSKCQLSEKFIGQAVKCGIVESIQSWMKFKAQEKLQSKCGSKKHSKLKGIPKLDDANDAGTKSSMECTLILTEGDSAKTLAVAGLGIVGRDKYGVFPLKGKVLNVREASHKQIMENAEINNIIKIVGLRYKEKYENFDSLKTLRYGKIMIMTDQDQDGSHIKGLLINFIHNNWPNLLKQNFLEEFITPIVKVTKNKVEKAFYSLPEFEEWKKDTENWHTWKVKYYKGLGTSTSKEAKEYFQDIQRNRIPFKYSGTEDDSAIVLAFSKKKIEERKEWLTNWMEERKRRAQLGLPELYLYGKETKQISFNEFINRELILFSNMDNERSIPSLMDGFKPGQRKVIFTCFKRNLNKEMKVAQLAGSVAEHSAYHHGEVSLMGTIINLAQNFVGSNNINLLLPIGQFGTRLHGGKDAASPRYIFTQLSVLARHIFNPKDEPLLNHNMDDNQKIEPQWYVPIIPMVLVNGAEGIGTGWSTRIHNHNPREIVKNLLRMLDGCSPEPMMPWFKNYNGTIDMVDETRYVFNGEISIIDETTVEITELPIRTWTQNYKENVLEPMLQGTDKTPAFIQDYKEYHSDTTVKFIVKMSPEKLLVAEDQGLHKVFKIQNCVTTNTMVLFDSSGCIHRYNNVEEILQEFYEVRVDFYQRRKDYLEGMLSAESLKLDNIARFICEKIDGDIVIENKPKKELIQMLVRRGYDSDPVKSWKESQSKLSAMDEGGDDEDEEDTSGPDFNYLLGMPLWNLTKEKKEELLKQRDTKAEELYNLKKKRPADLWKDDLEAFLAELDKVEEQEKVDAQLGDVGTVTSSKSGKGRARPKKIHIVDTLPSPHGRRVEPRIDSAIKAKAAAATAAKNRKMLKGKKLVGALDFDEDVEDDESTTGMSLADRLEGKGLKSPNAENAKPAKAAAGSKQPKITAAMAKKKEPKRNSVQSTLDDDDDDDETKPKKERKPREPREPKVKKEGGTPKKKGGKKRNPWSDESEAENNISDFSDEDLDDSFTTDVPLRERAAGGRRAAAAKVKYTFSDEEGDGPAFSDSEEEETKLKNNKGGDDSDFAANDSEDSYSAPPPKKAAPVPKKAEPVPKKITKAVVSDATDDEDSNPYTQNSSTGGFPASPVMLGDSDDDDPIFPSKPEPPKAEPPKKKTAAKKPVAPKADGEKPKKKAAPKRKKKTSDLSDFSDEDKPKPKKAVPKKKAAPKKSAFDSDMSDDEFDAKPKKAAPKKKKGSDDDDDEIFAPKKSKTAAKKKKDDSSDDEFNMEVAAAPRAGGGGRARQPVKYNFGDDDDDDDSDF